MSSKRSSFTYKIQDSLKFPSSGELVYAKNLEFYAPSIKHSFLAGQLEHMYSKALADKAMEVMKQSDASTLVSDIQSNRESDEKSGIDADTALFMFTSYCENFGKGLDLFKELIKQGCCKIDGQHAILDSTLNDMSYNDLKCCFGEYLVNFLSPTVFSAGQSQK